MIGFTVAALPLVAAFWANLVSIFAALPSLTVFFGKLMVEITSALPRLTVYSGQLLMALSMLSRFLPEKFLRRFLTDVQFLQKQIKNINYSEKFRQYLPQTISDKIVLWFNSEMSISFPEFPYIDIGDCDRSRPYKHVEAYLEQRCLDLCDKEGNLKVRPGKGRKPIMFSLDDFEKIKDEYQGIKVEWFSDKEDHKDRDGFIECRRSYQVTFPRCHKDLILNSYIKHVDEEGEKVAKLNKFQKIYHNEPHWNYQSFEHPASFDTVAMDPRLKKKIIDDLVAFRNGHEYYKRIGKSWKRGYLLYGPPGTGKSSMIAAMANFMQYDIYNLELTAVTSNTHLNKLLQRVGKKSILVIEDIDCSLDFNLTSKRKDSDSKDDKKPSELTLSGLLNSIDGLCSGCVQERLVVFTTNHVEKLDPALIRRGRMDMHVEMSYCRFEAFKVLAHNYLALESHPLFEKIKVLLEEVDMTPADVAENLMSECIGNPDVGTQVSDLEGLISALEEAKEAKAKAQEQQLIELAEKDEDDGDHVDEPGEKGSEETESVAHTDDNDDDDNDDDSEDDGDNDDDDDDDDDNEDSGMGNVTKITSGRGSDDDDDDYDDMESCKIVDPW